MKFTPPLPPRITNENNRLYLCHKTLEEIHFYSYPSLKIKHPEKINNKSQFGFLLQFSDKTCYLNTKTNL